jgi:hypothetical protein
MWKGNKSLKEFQERCELISEKLKEHNIWLRLSIYELALLGGVSQVT